MTGATMMTKKAQLYRMVLDHHVCPYGLKSKYLLERNGYEVEDHHLTTRVEVDAFKDKHNVKTTPQIWIDGKRVGGHDDLRVYLGLDDEDSTGLTYRPVITIFAIAALIALAISWLAYSSFFAMRTLELFIATSMTLLALQKLQDVERFSTSFLHYDLLARKWVPYSYLYPYGEALAGILMIAGALTWLSAPISLFIGTVGAYSVYNAVYVEKRELKCACVGGDSKVPLGFISLTENLMMIAMGLWMLFKTYG